MQAQEAPTQEQILSMPEITPNMHDELRPFLSLNQSRAKPDIIVRLGTSVLQVQTEHTGIRATAPIAGADGKKCAVIVGVKIIIAIVGHAGRSWPQGHGIAQTICSGGGAEILRFCFGHHAVSAAGAKSETCGRSTGPFSIHSSVVPVCLGRSKRIPRPGWAGAGVSSHIDQAIFQSQAIHPLP
jgi:hypothetical protein